MGLFSSTVLVKTVPAKNENAHVFLSFKLLLL
jgi:hypothetical protein